MQTHSLSLKFAAKKFGASPINLAAVRTLFCRNLDNYAQAVEAINAHFFVYLCGFRYTRAFFVITDHVFLNTPAHKNRVLRCETATQLLTLKLRRKDIKLGHQNRCL